MRTPALLLLAGALAPAQALAHATQPADGINWHSRDGRAALETTVGLLVSDDAGMAPDSWRWICHEALSASDSASIPRYDLVPGGILGAIYTTGDDAYVAGASVYRSADGCDWAPPAGLDGELVGDLAVRADGVVLAVTANLGGDNGALLSTDDGATFAPTALAGDDRVMQSAMWSGDRVYVGAALLSPFAATLLFSDDDGASWTERALPDGPEPETPRPIAVDPDDPDRLWLRMDGFAGDRLLRTDDAGESWTELLAVTGDLVDATLLDAELLVVTEDGALLSSATGFSEAADLPLLRATAAGPAGLLYVANAVQEPWLMGEEGDDGPDPTLLLTDLVGPLECPAASRAASACEVPWETVARVLGIWEGDVVDEPELPSRPPQSSGCGGGAALLPLLLPLVWLGPRRRLRPAR